ncbi:MAG: cell envelope biogenesis protein OmpA [Roseivirga sp.]|nr:cell envelope biogenesis protein OmpA [Roseivirga sp.]
MAQNPGFDQLRKILLEQDREEREELAKKLSELDDQLNSRDKLELRVDPILNDYEQHLKEKFSYLFGPQITESISKQIKDSQDEVVEVLYPIIGRMIKKYITNEIQKLSEKVDQQMELAFSWEGWKIRIKAWFTGTPQKELMISKLIEPKIEEIFVIERDSGIVMGTFSRKESVDQDMVAGMLTAIKAFVEDAFTKEKQELESIDYENYKIVLKSFKSFFIAVVTSGGMSMAFRDKLDDQLIDFADKVLKNARSESDESEEDQLSGRLAEFFNEFENGDK